MSETVELIRAYVEGYRGSRDVPAFEACVEAEINERFEQLQAQNAVLREAIIKTINDNLHLADGDVCTLITLKKALSIAPSECLEQSRKKDELIASLGGFLQTFRNRAHEDRDGYIFAITAKKVFIDELDKAIEAARAAGVEVK